MTGRFSIDTDLLNKVVASLRAQAARASGDAGEVEVTVGFTAAYALWVHENMEIFPPGMRLAGLSRDPRVRRVEQGGSRGRKRPRPRARDPKGRFWDPQGRAGPKFLENPARELGGPGGELARMVVASTRAGQTLAQALLQCGLRVQREAMRRVPIDTGNLRASAFTRLRVSGSVEEEERGADAGAEAGADPAGVGP